MDRSRYLLPLVAALALGPLTQRPALASERFAFKDDNVRVWNLAGRTLIEPGTGSEVVVLLDRGGADAAKLRIATEPLAGKPTLRVLYGSNRVVYRDESMPHGNMNNVQMRDDGTWGGESSMGSWWKNSGRRVTVSGRGSGLEAHADLRVQVPKGRQVSVYTVCGIARIANVDGRILFDGGSTDVTVNSCGGELSVDIGSGSVKIEKFDGDLHVDTGSGSVKLTDVAGARLHVDTGSGAVMGSQLAMRDILVDTGSGEVSLADVHASILKVDTGSGGVSLGLLSSRCDLDIDTGAGDVRIQVPPTFAAEVHIETGPGDIRSDLPMTVLAKDSDLLRARIGSGGARLHVDTGAGSVRLLASR